MDEKILEALSDIGSAIEKLTESLKSKDKAKSDAGKFLQSADLGKKLDLLSKEVKSIKSDTQKILKNQETLLKISRDKSSKTDIFEKSGEKKSKIKDGVSTVVMIAAGVLAIGLAFKIIGQVDFFSVIALSISLPLVALAFEKIAKLKDLNKADMKNLFLVTVTMALSLTAASRIMHFMSPITIAQGLTAILIAGTFAAISFSFSHLVKGLSEVKLKDLINMPIVLLAVSTAITMSSWIMKGIMPISISQGLTAILIAGTFAAVSFGMSKITKGIKDITADQVSELPDILLSFAAAITFSSWIMQGIMPISISQGLTAILIAGTFAVISFGIEKIIGSIEDVSKEQAAKIPLILIPVALAITASSLIMQAIMPITFAQGLTAIAIAAVFAIMSYSLTPLVAAVKIINLKDAIMIGLILPVLATAITLSSYILSKVETIPVETLVNIAEQAITMGIVALSVGGAAWLLSKMSLNSLVEGGIAVVILAGVVMASSLLLSLGNYSKYPKLDWVEGVGMGFVVFGAAAAALGLVALTGIGAGALLAGAGIILGLSYTMAKSSTILNNGIYNKYPSLDWAQGVSKSMVAFGKIVSELGLSGIFLNAIGSLIGSGPKDLAEQIVAVDKVFTYAGDKAFKIMPSIEWSSSVIGLLGQFASLSSMLSLGEIVSDAFFGSVPVKLAEQVVDVSNTLAGGDYSKTIPLDYMQSLSSNLKVYVDLVKYIQAQEIGALGFMESMSVTYGLSKLAEGYDVLAESISKLGLSINTLDLEKLSGINRLTGSVVLLSLMDPEQFKIMMDTLDDKSSNLKKVIDNLYEEGSTSTPSLSPLASKEDSTTQIVNLLTDIKTNTANTATGTAALATSFSNYLAQLGNKKPTPSGYRGGTK